MIVIASQHSYVVIRRGNLIKGGIMAGSNQIQTAVAANKEGDRVILLPAGPIRTKVEGASGEVHDQTLVDDAALGRPTQRIEPTATVFVHP